MKKLLLMFVALFVMGGGTIYADDTLDLTGDNFSNWGDGERTINADGSVTLTFTGAWGGAGWTYWSENLDLTQYSELCIVFKDNTTGGSVQVFLGDATDDYNSCTPASSSEVEGKLVFYIQNADVNCDLSKIGQLMIQTSAAGSVTIESITLMDEAVVDDEVIDIANADKTAWNDDSTDNITVNEDGTVTLKFVSEGDGGLGWTNWWPTWDASAYNYIVLNYKDLTSDTEGAYIQLYVGTSPEAVVVADEAVSGQIVVALADYPDYDFSSIGQIVVQGSAPLSVTVESLYFTTSLGGEEGGDDELTFEYEGLWYEVICEEETDDDGNVVSSTPTENCQIIAHEGTTYSGELTIPATASNGSHTYYVTRIDEAAFANSEISGHVVIPATILNVAKRAFENCTGITEVTYEYSETALADENGESATDYSFGGCTGVITVNLNRDITLGSGTRHCSPFDYNTSITTVFIGENVTIVPNYMFRNNSTKTLRYVTIYAETPPDWRYNPFDVIATDDDGNKLAVLYVHEASLDAYKSYENPNTNGDISTYASIFGEENILPIEGVPEGITNIETETSAKVTGIYNLAGQRVNENAKGILIKDGKKVLVK